MVPALSIVLLALAFASPDLTLAQPVPLGTATLSQRPLTFQGAVNPSYYTPVRRLVSRQTNILRLRSISAEEH